MSQQWTWRGVPATPAPDERAEHVRGAMHFEFARADFLDRLAEHAGIAEGDMATEEQFAAFDAHRRVQHEQDYDQHRAHATRDRDDEDREIGS